MLGDSLSLTSFEFWAAFAVGLAVLTPLARSRERDVAFAILNAGFVLAVGRLHGVAVLVGLGLVWALFRLVGWSKFRRGTPIAAVALLACTFLFVLHKLPEVAASLNLGPLSPALALIGFSYVFLRLIDMGRYVFEEESPPRLLDTINYLVPFHMLAAGPIQSYAEYLDRPEAPPALTKEDALEGVERIVWGLFKKLVLAHVIERVFLTGFAAPGAYWFLEMQLFFLWLFLDFSSYSDIAVGIGKLLGVRTPENFNKPYLARNIIEFWDRWHISLSLWIRRNLFIPIQLTLVRRGTGLHPLVPASVAFTVSFLLCGLWHDISVRYFLWGLLHAAGLVVTNLYRAWLTRRLGGRKAVKAYLKRPVIRVVAIVVTYEYVAASLLLIAS